MNFIQYYDKIKKSKVQFFNSTKFFNLLLHFSKNCTIKQLKLSKSFHPSFNLIQHFQIHSQY